MSRAYRNSSMTATFERTESILHQKLVSNLEQSHSLANIRDALLPKLLSGEIRMGETDKLVETREYEEAVKG